MKRAILAGTGGVSILTAGYMWIATQHWYDNIPGVSRTGPLNGHFAKDVALAYLVGGAALLWASAKQDKSVGVFGASWFVLHGLCHVWIWVQRGAPTDIVAATNLIGIQIPAFAALFCAITLTAKVGKP